MKKKFKETFIGKLLKGVAEGALDILPIPDIRNYFAKDEDGNGKISLKEIDFLKVGGAAVGIAILIKLELIDLTVVIQILKALTGFS